MKYCRLFCLFTAFGGSHAAAFEADTPIKLSVPSDAWLICDHNVVATGERVWFSFVRGEAFPIATESTIGCPVGDFQERSDGLIRPLRGLASQDGRLAARIHLEGTGIHVVGCSASHSPLASESADRARISHFDFAKTVIEVLPSSPDETGSDALLGHQLEIVPLSNPCHWRVGERVKIRVLLEGHPWRNVQIAVGHEGLEIRSYTSLMQTDRRGEAAVLLDRAGHGFIRAGILRRTEGLGRPAVESLTATLTYRVRGHTNLAAGLQSVRAVHGSLDPWAVIGYRMGVRALRELELAAGSVDLEAIHRSPALPVFSGVLDGIQAATRLSLGQLNLRMEETAEDVVETFIGQPSTRRLLAFRPSDSFLKRAASLDEEDASEVAQEIATWSDEKLFEIRFDLKPEAIRTASAFAPLPLHE